MSDCQPIPPLERYPELSALEGISHGLVLRQPGIEVSTDREATLARLDQGFSAAVREIGLEPSQMATAEQVHGGEVRKVDGPGMNAGVDGLVTDSAGLGLGIVVADCGAVFIVDPVNRAIGLVHSGKKGTEARIAVRAMELMGEAYGSDPAQMVVRLSACIRPPAYEVDIAAMIRDQVIGAGVPAGAFHDDGVCTTSDLQRYYSYRAEKGATGRMLAALGLK